MIEPIGHFRKLLPDNASRNHDKICRVYIIDHGVGREERNVHLFCLFATIAGESKR